MIKTMNQKLSIGLAVFSIGYLYLSFNLREYPYVPVDSDLVPKILGFLLLGLAFFLYFDKSAETEEQKAKRVVPKKEIMVMLGVAGMILVYIFFFEILGFLIITTLFIFACSTFLGYRRWLTNCIVSIVFPGSLYYLFNYLLQIKLPQGILPF
ncbi:tripartite tricarboxylate transporter TctB family protein [Halobacillus sp. Marseille-Q1614]|uniref:tripartite tricarboxylate transporter TctB family protein n=1 Tax=Halobacillus sp. Marseille-Q1614 TaxID=2709134 RepID=UPI00156FD8B3|nr:tripartite tricarboxylate transporter TctB family protein [Halobacillus sp. Marseille-Q1614]